jgi:hypothetical protein
VLLLTALRMSWLEKPLLHARTEIGASCSCRLLRTNDEIMAAIEKNGVRPFLPCHWP